MVENDKSKIIIKILKKLSSKLKAEIEDLNKNAPNFNQTIPSDKEIKLHLDRYCSEKDIDCWILAYEKNLLIGKLAIFKRRINFSGNKIILGGIGKLRVRIDKRNHGIASEMIQNAMQELKDINCDVAFLSTNTKSFLATFYNKYGFILLNKPFTYLGLSGKRYESSSGMIAPIKSKIIFNNIIRDKNIFDIGLGEW